MARESEEQRPDFEQALGETFGSCVSPPVPFEDASAHECCEVIWSVVGRMVTPSDLAALTEAQIVVLSQAFGAYFEAPSPSVDQMKTALAQILARWPVGSLGE